MLATIQRGCHQHQRKRQGVEKETTKSRHRSRVCSAMVRVRAGISYALTEAMVEGHRGLPTDELVPLAEKLLEVRQLIRTAVELELQEGTVIAQPHPITA